MGFSDYRVLRGAKSLLRMVIFDLYVEPISHSGDSSILYSLLVLCRVSNSRQGHGHCNTNVKAIQGPLNSQCHSCYLINIHYLKDSCLCKAF